MLRTAWAVFIGESCGRN